MQILVLGPPRVGTQSLADAIEKLGYNKVYHMREVAKCSHQEAWTSLITKKSQNPHTILPQTDFDPILTDYDGLADFPASIFVADLVQAYPDAKIIIAKRTEESWIKSMLDTLVYAHSNPKSDSSPSPSMTALRDAYHGYCWKDDFEANGREYFRRYYDEVAAATKGRETLDFTLGQGWESLCAFLGKPVPDEVWPRSDDWVQFRRKKDQGRIDRFGGETKAGSNYE